MLNAGINALKNVKIWGQTIHRNIFKARACILFLRLFRRFQLPGKTLSCCKVQCPVRRTSVAMLMKVLTLRRVLLLLVMVTALGLVVWFYLLRFSVVPARRPKPVVVSPWTWECHNQTCVRKVRMPNATQTSSINCQMSCGPTPLWPQPTGIVRIGKRSVAFQIEQLQFQVPSENIHPALRETLHKAAKIFRDNLEALIPSGESADYRSDVKKVTVKLVVIGSGSNDGLTLVTDENYRMTVAAPTEHVVVRIIGESFYGVRHGLETLSQLVWWNGSALRILHDALITDAPRFAYRGLMLDTARNFYPMSALRTTIDAMAASKFNVFHWHISDSQSFPFVSPRQPNMSLFGAYSQDEVYSAKDVSDLAEYARIRGVRVLPEVDAPAHAGSGWQWGEAAGLGKLSLCIDRQPWKEFCGQPPCGQLNPLNDNTYRVLGDIYFDLADAVQPTDMFHLGADEVNQGCWGSELLNSAYNYSGFFATWMHFETRMLQEARAAMQLSEEDTLSAVVWSSELTRSGMLDPAIYVVQVWGGSTWSDTEDLIDAGYRVILSHVDAWYLDCGLGDYRSDGDGPCSPRNSWQRIYRHRPWTSINKDDRALVLGGEACLWSEHTDANALPARLWPRTAALAERLWTDPEPTIQPGDVYQRLARFRELLLTRGVSADAMEPRWCRINPGMCL